MIFYATQQAEREKEHKREVIIDGEENNSQSP